MLCHWVNIFSRAAKLVICLLGYTTFQLGPREQINNFGDADPGWVVSTIGISH